MVSQLIYLIILIQLIIGAKRAGLKHFLRKRRIGVRELAEDTGREVEIATGVLKEEVVKLFNDVKK